MSALAHYLAAALALPLVGDGALDELVAANPLLAERTSDVAHALLRGSERDDVLGLGCIEALVLAIALRNEPDLMPADATCAFIGRQIELAGHAARWIERLLEARSYASLETLADLDDPMPDDAIRAFALAVLPLAVALEGENASAAASVLGAIAKRHREDAADLAVIVPNLCEALQDPSATGAAAHALAVIGDPRAIEPLIAKLPDHSCIRALGDLKAEAALAPLCTLLRATRDPPLRDRLIRVLLRIDAAAAAPVIAQTANPDQMCAPVVDAVEQAAARGDAASWAFLVQASRSTNDRMRAYARSARRRLRR